MSKISSGLKSFTLIELVIVLALLAILSALAVSKFVDLSKKAYDATENATIDAMRAAILLYKAKYDSWPDCTDIELFKLLENPPIYTDLEQPPGGWCPHDGIRWCIYKFRYAGQTVWSCTIECPHWKTDTGVAKAWEYSGPGTEAIGKTPGSIKYLKNSSH